MHVNYEIVSDPDRFGKIAIAWTKLWHHASGEVFQAHDWIGAWRVDAGSTAKLHIGCAWRGDDLIAVLPLCVHKWHGLRVLEWTAQSVSDYCDVLTQADDTIIEQLWQTVHAAGGFDLIRLKHIRANARMYNVMQNSMREERVEFSLQVAGAWTNGASWFRTLNKKVRNNHTRGKRILGESGAITIRQLAADEPYEPVIQCLLALKRQREDYRDSPMVRNDTTLMALVSALEKLGVLRIFIIEQNGKIIAGSVNAVHQRRMLALFAAYDLAHDRAGAGIILMTEYSIWSFDHDLTAVDYLLGAEPYKFKFATQETKLHIFIKPRTWRGRIAVAAYTWKQRRAAPEPEVIIGNAYLTSKGTPRTTNESVTVLEPERDLLIG